MKIAIRFGDNDFGNTFEGLLKWIFTAYKHQGLFTDDKERLAWMINQLSPIAYIAFQNHWEYNGLEEAGPTEVNQAYIHAKNYLQVAPENILLNEEVDAFLANLQLTADGWDNSETFILDTELHNNNIYSV